MANKTETSFECTICSSSLKTRKNLKKHIEAVHEKKKPYQCIICLCCFSRKEHLAKHTNTVHEKKRPFKCNFCILAFGSKANLKKHICSYGFADKRYLRNHIKINHEKLRNLQV